VNTTKVVKPAGIIDKTAKLQAASLPRENLMRTK
jgi:hypothetical protein